MADTQAASLCLVGAMDRLWFHHAVFFPEPISLLCLKSPQLISDSKSMGSSSSKSSLSDAQDIPSVLAQKDEAETEEIMKMQEKNPAEDGKRQTQITQIPKKACSKSHSPKHERKSKSVTKDSITSSKRLEKICSSKTYEDLEQEEVKGFIDLGFRFNKEDISHRMMTVVPGLQRIIKTSPSLHVTKKSEMEHMEFGSATMRPYLSEAWLIKKPDSPLLNMRVRRGYAAADMKKQLRSWARNVAYETIHES